MMMNVTSRPLEGSVEVRSSEIPAKLDVCFKLLEELYERATMLNERLSPVCRQEGPQMASSPNDVTQDPFTALGMRLNHVNYQLTAINEIIVSINERLEL